MTKNTYIKNGFVSENTFRTANEIPAEIPEFKKSKNDLPQPYWKGHDKEIGMYWKSWEIGFSHLKKPTPQNGFLSSYLDTAYNGNIFMWDSVFISHYCRYGIRVFPFQQTLDNFYRKQHLDGFICREIYGESGEDAFQRHDPASTGPNVFAWSEMEYYKAFGDKERLNSVFPVLCGFHEWLKENRTWKDGSYWTSGWGSGMDTVPRLPEGRHVNFSHGHMSWIDACLQQYMDAQILIQMGFELERWQEIEGIEEEIQTLGDFIRQNMWDNDEGFLFDLLADGSRVDCKHIGAFWALHSDVLGEKEKAAMIRNLQKGGTFDHKYIIPSLDPDHPRFRSNGRYWQGGVWAPTNYMIFSGLQKSGEAELAHKLGKRHLEHVLGVFQKTGTFWEYYSPDEVEPGFLARPDFVGWTGLVPISVLFEQVMGIRPDYSRKEIHWDLFLTEEHGIDKYPFGPAHTLNLRAAGRSKAADAPVISVECQEEITLILRWNGKEERHTLKKGKHTINPGG